MLTAEARKGMLQIISDLSKEAYGFRVRKDYTNVCDEELQADWDHYIREADRRAKEQAESEAMAFAEWNERIVEMMVYHNIDKSTAVRWDMMAFDEEDFEHYLWKNGIDLRLTGKLGKELGFKVYGYWGEE